jgi:hypothetical protein
LTLQVKRCCWRAACKQARAKKSVYVTMRLLSWTTKLLKVVANHIKILRAMPSHSRANAPLKDSKYHFPPMRDTASRAHDRHPYLGSIWYRRHNLWNHVRSKHRQVDLASYLTPLRSLRSLFNFMLKSQPGWSLPPIPLTAR